MLNTSLDEAGVSIAELARNAAVHEAAGGASTSEGSIKALPNVANPAQPEGVAVGEVSCGLDDMNVIVGVGEVSSWGSGRTRREAEYGIRRDGSVELTAAAAASSRPRAAAPC